MGMFTSVIDPVSGIEYQIKCGWDECAIFKLGDTVPSRILENYPKEGYLLDDVYEACAYPNKDAWVVIKDSMIVAIEPNIESEEDNYCRLREKYQIKEYPDSLWNKSGWLSKKTNEEKNRKEHEEFMKSISHLSSEEQLGMLMARPISRKIDYASLNSVIKIEKL